MLISKLKITKFELNTPKDAPVFFVIQEPQ